MDINKVRSIPRRQRRTKHLTVRVSQDIVDWLKKNRLSATKIFYEAIRELGYKRQSK